MNTYLTPSGNVASRSIPRWLGGLLALAVACGSDKAEEEKAEAPPPVQVRAEAARSEAVVFYDTYPGTVVPLEQVEVRPQVAGYITRMHFTEGTPVRKGQVLYTIDTRQYSASVDISAADVSAAEANLALAEKDVARYRRLAAAEAIAQQTLDQAVAQAEAQRQAVASAKARVAQANTQLSYATVRAPISGRTGLDAVKVGTQVAPGTPLLTTVSQEAPVGVDFSLPQTAIPRVAAAEAAPGSVPDSTFRLLLPDGSRYGEFGRVFALDRAVDPATGTLRTRLTFDDPDGLLRTGMNVEVELLNRDAGAHVTVPTTALAEQMGEQYVFVRADTIALRQKVTTGARFRDRVIVEEGVEAGAEVLVAGLNRVRDSTRVAVVREEAEGQLSSRGRPPSPPEGE